MITIGHRTVWNELHLLGGLRASTSTDNQMIIFPSTSGETYAFPAITDTKKYCSVIRSIGSDLIGHEEHTKIDSDLDQPIWYLFENPNRADDVWSGIGNTAREMGNEDMANLARNVAFALRTSALRLRDCSREYAWQNHYAIQRKIRPDGRFSNIKSFDLDMALHSLLADIGTARDYLAHFISRYILVDDPPVDSMAKLYNRTKKAGLTSLDLPARQLLEAVLVICDPKHPHGWMAQVSEFRNIIIHRAPLQSLSNAGAFIHAKTLNIGNKAAYQIYFGVPHNPFLRESPQVDALTHFHWFLLRLREFAHLVAKTSEIRPTIPDIKVRD